MGKLDKQELIWELAPIYLLEKNLLFVSPLKAKPRACVEQNRALDISILIASNFKIRVYIMED